MSTPIRTPRRPATAQQPRPELPSVPWQGLFLEAAYEGGQLYALEPDEDDDGD